MERFDEPPPAFASQCAIWARDADEVQELAEQGIALRGGPRHFTVLLPGNMTASELLVAAERTHDCIVQLEPLFRPPVL